MINDRQRNIRDTKLMNEEFGGYKVDEGQSIYKRFTP